MYPYGAASVKCALCHYVTNVGVSANFVAFFVPFTESCTLPYGET